MSTLTIGLEAVERGLVPDAITRAAIRRLCRQRLRDNTPDSKSANTPSQQSFLQSMSTGPIALVPEMANAQHYELPPEFFKTVLGPHRKYSCCFWPTESATLAEAEAAALELTCHRAELQDGHNILELGCGWGSLSLWMARQFPNSRITAVSNSAPQRRFIESAAAIRGLTNLRVITADINQLTAERSLFHRIISIEMFEHMRNYELLLNRIASWLKPDGKLFVHHFCHRQLAYPFETDGAANWMGRYFFTGGLMPSENMLQQFPRDLTVTGHWTWDGTHYQRTAEAWLTNLDAHRLEIIPLLERTYGREARRWFYRWRMFFLAVAELFGIADGTEWYVSHSLLEHNGA